MNKIFLFLSIAFMVFFISCEKKHTQPEFPVSLFSTGGIIESKVRLFVRDGEVFDEKVINDFLGKSKDFFSMRIKSNEVKVRFLSEKEFVLDGDKHIYQVIKEGELFKMGYTSTVASMPSGLHGHIIYKNVLDNFDYYNYNNLYASQIEKHTTESVAPFSSQRYFYPAMIARGNFEHLYFSFITYKVACYAYQDAQIKDVNVYTCSLGNELNDMNKLKFRRDDNKWAIQYNDTVAVKEFRVEFKAGG